MPPAGRVLDAARRDATGAAIARVQRADGAIPWFADGPVDPWDHVEAAMGLTLTGRHAAARRAYRWLQSGQRGDGSWASRRVRGAVTDASGNTGFAVYLAVGALLEVEVTGDITFAHSLWPTIERAVGFVLALQQAGGEVWWARDPQGTVYPQALLTGSSSVLLSLRCASALADRLGVHRPEWELAATRLAAAVSGPDAAFAPSGRHAMDWYWPVLAGAVAADDAVARLTGEWQRYVVDGLGVRCVDDRPWVTGAETAELALALTVAGQPDAARRVLADVQHLRDADGRYWTGWVVPDRARWPVERTTWTAAAMLLADDALVADSPVGRVLAARSDLVSGDAPHAVIR